MRMQDSFNQLARYNQWMNGKLLAALGRLPAGGAYADCGAFFG